MTALELDRVMAMYWDTVLREAADPWARKFALSIKRRARDPLWLPSEKQARVMRTMVQELFTPGIHERS